MNIVDIFLHLDQHLLEWINYFGSTIYLILFLIIFAETGLVVTPFLPGDSLLFAVGAMTAIDGGLDLFLVLALLTIAGIIGDGVNYHIGKKLGVKAFEKYPKLFKPQYLHQTEDFYKKWGSFTIVAARFAPIVRTFAPFVAGIGSMKYRHFLLYNLIGAVAWVFTFTLAGHFFGNIPAVKRNFQYVILAVIFLSILPMLIPIIKNKLNKNKNLI